MQNSETQKSESQKSATRAKEARIKILPPALADRIAAGEVVERPASAIKELVENSLDSGATHIIIEVKAGGVKEMSVSDNGCGIHKEELELAVCRHATSKISSAKDLDAIRTLGFRGEALPSIAAVSRFTIASRLADSDEGYRLTVEGGKIGQVSPFGMAQGTKVVIKDLFYNTPARLKFLKTEDTENGHITEAVTRLGLGALNVHFTFIRDGREVLDLPAGMTIAERAARLLKSWGGDKLVSAYAVMDNIKVYGLIGPPNINVGTSRAMYAYLNGRYIHDKVVVRAILDAYKGMLPKGRYPAALLFIEMEPSRFDINVHPQKYEVRFAPGVQIVRAIIKAAADGLIKSHISEDKRQPERVVQISSPLQATPGSLVPPAKNADMNFDKRRAAIAAAIEKHLERRGGISEMTPTQPRRAEIPIERPPTEVLKLTPEQKPPTQGSLQTRATAGVETSGQKGGFFSSLEVIGQTLGTYMVCEQGEDVVFVDQHAAHERITYARLSEGFARREIPRQRLLLPERVPLMPSEARALAERKELIERLGFEITGGEESVAIVSEVPDIIASENIPAIVRDMLFDIEETGSEGRAREAFDEIISRIACHSSVRAGKALSIAEMEALLRRLDETELSAFCPHGRPVYFRLTKSEIEKRFSRT